VDRTVTLPPGQVDASVEVPLRRQQSSGSTTSFTLQLSGAVGASVGRASGTVTIVDDQGARGLSVDDVTVVEGDAGVAKATIDVQLAQAQAHDVTVDWATEAATARAPRDYGTGLGTITIPAGQTLGKVRLVVRANVNAQPTKQFFVELSNPSGAPLDSTLGIVTTLDND
jgi:hypothetical protein